ncbi:Bug family tripartite tricarboxylate transporter substrate binding protein [Paracraurococcus lichenis]|uniref:Tripartite tricarboxylate transporter substrate binding protein n=1 Tax=Paracraurococcus lichenis TaxID=3064888 RepID=A0ABT9DXI0_9PROT|nr:tripartite tricarboxylate transporter substrate binding protein [Paracraurococcus sp. LOR1-02]MDO9708598.1 tripartite tricarboxylate transporter substrate binding protein [Paracraurococcus sp. LOR1-02]
MTRIGAAGIGRRGVLAAGAALAAPAVRAQGIFPDRTVTLVACFPPGGSTDLSARLVAPGLSEILGKPVVVENRAGAGGNIGMGYVARAAPDGHTLLVASSVFVVNVSLYRNPPYDPFRDFVPVGTLGASPNLICVRTDSGITSLHQLIAMGKAQPDRFNYASPGIGTTPHLAGEVLKLRTGLQMQHVPFQGAGPAVQAILAGTVEVLVASQGGAVETAHRNGQTRVLAQTGARRSPDLPEIPTLDELGVTEAVSETFNAMYAPAGTPQPIVDRLAATVLAVLARPDVQLRFRTGGVPVVPEGADGLRARVAREVPLWRDVIRQAKITAD